MAYWLLLGFVYCLGCSLLLFHHTKKDQKSASILAGLGFLFFSVGLGAELALGLEFDENALRIFYLFRIMLPLAWIGHSLFMSFWPNQEQVRWLNYGLLLVSLAGAALVWRTGITAAQNWFDPGQPAYDQYAQTLATNRPTRGLVVLLNVYGGLGLVGSALFCLWAGRKAVGWRVLMGATAILLGVIGLVRPLLRSPLRFDTLFYLGEWLPAALLFAGLLYFLNSVREKPAFEAARQWLAGQFGGRA